MSFANIIVKELDPPKGDQAIARETVFTFRLAPVGSSTTIDISTLDIEIKVQTSSGTFTYDITYTSSEVTYTIKGNSYLIEVDVDPDGAVNFDSNETITLTINVDDTDGNSMRQFQTNYRVVNMTQLTALVDLTSEFTEIPINYEQGRISYDGSECNFTWKNWMATQTPVVYVNDMMKNSGYTPSYVEGKLTFSPVLSSGYNKTDIFNTALYEPIDRVNCDYWYSCFSTKQLTSFMKVALADFNASYPVSSYGVTSSNQAVQAALLLGGAYYLYNAVVAGFLNQQWRVQWGEEEWQNLLNVAEKMKENTKSVFERISEAKRHTLAKGVQGIVIPEYSLPGGRSRFTSILFGQSGAF